MILLPRDVGSTAVVDELYDPRSRSFGHYQAAAMNPAPLAARQTLADFGREHALQIQWQAGELSATLTGPIAAIDAVFGVRVRAFLAPDGTKFLASRNDPHVPAELRPWFSAAGRISTYFPLRRPFVPTNGVSPTGVLAAYDIRPLRQLGIDGRGQTLVFFETDGFDPSDLSAFASHFHLAPFNVSVHGPHLSPGQETPMDLEVAHAIAPRAKIVVYNYDWQSAQNNLSEADAFSSWVSRTNDVVRASGRSVISESLGLCDQFFGAGNARALQRVYAQADLMGESVFVSSGDSGAYECLSAANTGTPPGPQYLGVPLPAGCPGVTAVGGTLLSVHKDGSWAGETTWEGPIETSGGGGGISRYFSQPSWQAGPGVAEQNSAANSGRNRMTPDVAADADPNSGTVIRVSGNWSQGGGTSQAAPIWAGITALLDQYLAGKHLPRLGFANPALYALARTPQARPPFHDVTLGNNLHYPSVLGYDMATGLGTPDVWNLARDLVTYDRTGR